MATRRVFPRASAFARQSKWLSSTEFPRDYRRSDLGRRMRLPDQISEHREPAGHRRFLARISRRRRTNAAIPLVGNHALPTDQTNDQIAEKVEIERAIATS
jgi:hypothetical protein